MNRVSYDRVPKDGTAQNVTGYVTMQFTYYVSGMVFTIMDGDGHQTNFFYDAPPKDGDGLSRWHALPSVVG